MVLAAVVYANRDVALWAGSIVKKNAERVEE